jgi:threonine dehydratase
MQSCEPVPAEAPESAGEVAGTISVDADDVARAHAVVAPHVRRTPILELSGADLGLPGVDVVLKLEAFQRAGSFKARGAFANLLLRDVPPGGVVAASGGNHGAAIAFAARDLGVPATIFVPETSSPAKIARIRTYGATLRLVGTRYDDALRASLEWAAGGHALPVHAFDQRETVMGAGSLGRELGEQAPDLDEVLVAVGGGGLIAGVAAWYAGALPGTRVVGVEPEASPTLTVALRAGRPADAPTGGIANDSLAPRRVGRVVYPIARAHVAATALVTDAAIVEAQRLLWDAVRVVAEPGAAAPLAALLSGAHRPAPGSRVGVVVSGANTTAVRFDDAPDTPAPDLTTTPSG